MTTMTQYIQSDNNCYLLPLQIHFPTHFKSNLQIKKHFINWLKMIGLKEGVKETLEITDWDICQGAGLSLRVSLPYVVDRRGETPRPRLPHAFHGLWHFLPLPIITTTPPCLYNLPCGWFYLIPDWCWLVSWTLQRGLEEANWINVALTRENWSKWFYDWLPLFLKLSLYVHIYLLNDEGEIRKI